MSGSARCRYCERPIVWATTARGARVCIDPEPSTRGDWVLEATGTHAGKVLFAARRERPDDAPGRRHTSHFDTCPVWRARNARGAS